MPSVGGAELFPTSSNDGFTTRLIRVRFIRGAGRRLIWEDILMQRCVTRFTSLFVLPLLLAASCWSEVEEESQGGLGEPCYSDDTCDEKLVCEDGVCVELEDEGQGGLGESCYPNDTCNPPYVCEEGTCQCVPDCTERECGPDPVCGQSCGTCSSGFCLNDVCCPHDTLVDQFQQRDAALDVLWVINTARTMSHQIQSLQTTFHRFVAVLADLEMDFRLGMTTTNLSVEGGGGRLIGDPPVLGPDDDLQKFIARVDRYFMEGAEESLESARRVLSAGRHGFPREEAMLAVILLTDEDDSSPGSVGFYERYLLGAKGAGNSDLVRVFALAGDVPYGCVHPDYEHIHGAVATPAERLHSVVKATGGVFGSICADDYGPLLEKIGLESAGMRREFPLSRQADPARGIKVLVNNEEIDEHPVEGWQYDESSQSIRFDGRYIPLAGSVIHVRLSFEPVDEEQCFCISDEACGEGFFCDEDARDCRCKNDDACGDKAFCNDYGFCQERAACASSFDCFGGLICDTSKDLCIAECCAIDADCPIGRMCEEGACRRGCTSDDDCWLAEACIEGHCRGHMCNRLEQCGMGELCVDGACVEAEGGYCAPCSPGPSDGCGTDEICVYDLVTSGFCAPECDPDGRVPCPNGYSCEGMVVPCQNGVCGLGVQYGCESFEFHDEYPQEYCVTADGELAYGGYYCYPTARTCADQAVRPAKGQLCNILCQDGLICSNAGDDVFRCYEPCSEDGTCSGHHHCRSAANGLDEICVDG